MLIADEAHSLGAESFIRNKPQFFERRLALSATPERQYDPDGTEEIFAFFGPTVYEFGLDRAIGFCLVPYKYYVHACTLNGNELEKFEQLSQRIGAAIGSGASEEDTGLQGLLIARRRIIETAGSKIDLLRDVLVRRVPRHLEHALIYASAKNPQQFDELLHCLPNSTSNGLRSPRRQHGTPSCSEAFSTRSQTAPIKYFLRRKFWTRA